MKIEWKEIKESEAMEYAIIEKLFKKENFRVKRIKMDADKNKKIQEARLKFGGGFDDELA